MGGLGGRPYSHDPNQRQGLSNIMLRPVSGAGSSTLGSTNFSQFQDVVVGYHTYRRFTEPLVGGQPRHYTGPWDYKGFSLIVGMSASLSFSLDPGQTSKSASETVVYTPRFLDENFADIPGTTITASVSLTQTRTSTSTSGTSNVNISNENMSFNENISGHIYDLYDKSVPSGSFSSTGMQGYMGLGYIKVTNKFKAVNIKPMPVLSMV